MKQQLSYKSLLLILSIWVLGSAQAQQEPTQVYSLKDCIDFTLGKNPSNIVYENQVKIAERQQQEGLASYLPQINFTGTFDDNLKRPVTVIPAGAFSPTDIKVQFGNQYATALTLQADQVIYDQSVIEGIKANKPNIEMAKFKKMRNDDDLIYSTAAAYYQVLIYKEQLKLLSENEKKFTELLAVQKLQFEKGAITKVSLNRVQVSYNNIQSQKKVAQTNHALALNRLKNAMGLDLSQDIKIVDSMDYNQNATLPQANDFEINNKPDYLILQKNVELQAIDLRRKKAAMLPTLNAYGRYGANAFGNDLAKSYKQLYDFAAVGLRLNVPIFGSFKRYSQIKQSELNLLNNKQNLLINAQTLKLQVENSNTQLLSSYNNMISNKNNLTLAKEVFDDTNFQYQKGAVTLTDFLNSDYSYKEAQSNYINSLLNYLIARIDLERSKGTIKQFASQL